MVADWHVSVTLVKALTNTYVGNMHEGGRIFPAYVRGSDNLWRSSVDDRPVDQQLNELLNWTLQRALELGAESLSARWGEKGPELLP